MLVLKKVILLSPSIKLEINAFKWSGNEFRSQGKKRRAIWFSKQGEIKEISRTLQTVVKNGFYKNRKWSQPLDLMIIAIDGSDRKSFNRIVLCDCPLDRDRVSELWWGSLNLNRYNNLDGRCRSLHLSGLLRTCLISWSDGPRVHQIDVRDLIALPSDALKCATCPAYMRLIGF